MPIKEHLFDKRVVKRALQEGLLDKMQHRRDLYDLLDYEAYSTFDTSIYNFRV